MAPKPEGLPFPVKLGGPFTLTDHTGTRRSEADPNGRMQLLFFGYANCEAICSVALPLMAEVTDTLREAGVDVQPVMVTVDPERDTSEAMGPALAKHHEDFVGLTGTEAELAAVYDLYAVEKTIVFEDPLLGPIYAHGSHVYLLDAEGKFLTLLPPILSADRVAEIAAAYADPNS
ncbi:MAG: SCO family protein [Pseudomonadota bacterium]